MISIENNWFKTFLTAEGNETKFLSNEYDL